MIGAHPEIFVSPTKEPDFFAADIRAAVPELAGRSTDDWSRYLELFSGATADQRAGEGSVSYLASGAAAAAIHDRCPDARILMVLRDPVDRLYSHYTAARIARATSHPFAEWLAEKVRGEATDTAPIGPVAPGRYGSHLQRYLNVFPASRIHIVWYEDFTNNAAQAVREVLTFLGVDDTREMPTTLRRNETRVPRWGGLWSTRPTPARPSSKDRAQGIQLYADDIRHLASVTGRDLGRWTDPRG